MTDEPQTPTTDPTENVKALTQAAVQRLDDLRSAEIRWNEQTSRLRAYYETQLREAEAKRIDAIRAVDVGAVQRAAEVSATQAQTLAIQVATSAETLRSQVAAAQSAAVTSLAAALDPIQKDIADLRRVQYEQVGQKAQVTEGRSGNAALYAAVSVGATILLTIMAVVGFVVSRIGV